MQNRRCYIVRADSIAYTSLWLIVLLNSIVTNVYIVWPVHEDPRKGTKKNNDNLESYFKQHM